MAQKIILNIAFVNWILGMIFLVISNASFIISKSKYVRKDLKKYRMGYTIKEIREAIENIDKELTKKKLENKITFRKIAILLFISTPILIIIANV